ncbi:MAG: 16S rRNA (cytosine(1402)-N(4))-methyltransferase RsmH, partial [Candidatus Omnitrophota bacterium]|nr:16S rRNA (cytosine(1402)-N(4))-methyltransferase RsmH [Candidatus Omnitrophota bacterium]
MLIHRPVMLKEVLSFLNLKDGGIVLDATVGGGAHAIEMLKRVLPGGRLIGLDADKSALDITETTLKDFNGSFKLINGNFRDLDALIVNEGIKGFDAILFDVGVSSYQIENGVRGFSIKEDAILDMRMDPLLALTAYDIVNKYKEKDLSELIEKFGEERLHARIARFIVSERSKRPIETTHDLAAIIRKAAGFRYRKSRIDPATRTFQARRISVNEERE